ncbi:MFS transporter [Dehalobacter sp. DCM]|uniref:MFS transporter n=1 Tax=Dehalobacter sp. DCM TaxID=2907827 RepID=UPI0030817DBF|nr:MFS transporter [Dehalobacter sp. DCM]
MSTKRYSAITKCAILSIIIVQYAAAATTPALGAIAMGLTGVSEGLIKQIVSLPNLLMIPAALLCGQLVRIMKKRTLLNISMLLMLIGGVLPGFFGDIYFILAMRAVFGIGYGFVFTLSISWISDVFEGKERADMYGFQAAIGALAGVVYQLAGGSLAAINWRYAFFSLFIMVPFIFLIFFKLPEPEKRPLEASESGVSKGKLSPMTWILSILNLACMIFLFSYMTDLGIVIAVEQIANPAVVGTLMSTFVGGAFVCGLIYGKLDAILKKYTIAFQVLLIGVGMCIMLFSHSLTPFFVASFIFGMGFGGYNPCIFGMVANSADKNAATLAFSVYLAINALGQFLSPIVLGFLKGLFGINVPRGGWMIAGPLLVISALVIVIVQAVKKPKAVPKAINE